MLTGALDNVQPRVEHLGLFSVLLLRAAGVADGADVDPTL